MKMACGCCEIVLTPLGEYAVECIPAHSNMPEPVHEVNKDYPCAKTGCANYTPAHYPVVSAKGFAIWPKCVCGEVAQEHT